ncbi:MAG: di-trans,poly-cis-decaprenylcistransferase [Alphaproteobacteria bacterium]|nr:di-trans,poly-cis-decaprenylcistransferase [Alphaproteobacteria bacterium]
MGISTTIQHLAVILDGNGRWATLHGLARLAGHEQGVKAVEELVRNVKGRGIPWLTLFCFSTENWRRPNAEVETLLRIMAREAEATRFRDEGIRVHVLGYRQGLSAHLQERLALLEQQTADQTELNLILAINHGGRDDILRTTQAIAAAAAEQSFDPARLTEEMFSQALWHMSTGADMPGLADILHGRGGVPSTAPCPPPELVIRTGAEQRLSNFLLWQLAYSELIFLKTLWPDFDATMLDACLQEYASRDRRFGGI